MRQITEQLSDAIAELADARKRLIEFFYGKKQPLSLLLVIHFLDHEKECFN
jgi:hypothetical protein